MRFLIPEPCRIQSGDLLNDDGTIRELVLDAGEHEAADEREAAFLAAHGYRPVPDEKADAGGIKPKKGKA